MLTYDEYLRRVEDGTIRDDMSFEEARAMESITPTLPEKIARNTAPGESIAETFQKLATGLILSNQQYQLTQMNLEIARQNTERAKRGERALPYLDATSASGVGVNVGLSQGTQQLVLYLALGAGALILLNSFMRR